MELMTCGMRQSTMMSVRQVRGTVLAVLLSSVLAGCGSVTASAPAGAGASSSAPATSSAQAASSASASSGAASSGTAAAAAATGCASVNQATAVTYPSTAKGTVRCPADFGISYLGTFYDGSRTLAKFIYGASGCQIVSLT